MKKLLLLSITLLAFCASAQRVAEIAIETDPGWYRFKTTVNLSTEEFLKTAISRFDLSSDYSFEIKRVDKDELGYSHTRIQQLYKGVNIEGAEFILHEKDGRLQSMNGHLKGDLNLSVSTALNANAAIGKAMEYIGAQEYMWESEANNQFLQDALNDPSATYYPNPELMIIKPENDGADYELCYKVNIFASDPFLKMDVYVEAQLGEVLFAIDALHHADSNGLAHTRYSGTQNIVTDYISPTGLFRLRESKGGGIHTYNARTGMFPIKDFIDSNNVWNNVNVHQDEVATDVHWGAENAYDYFLEKHNRSSYDNLNSRIISFVHASGGDGAMWDGQHMHFSDGNLYGPTTCIDIVGHEFTHGVVEYTAGLSYTAFEAASLNESFCNIFGTMIEFYADSTRADYLIAEDTDTSGKGWYSMEDPQSLNSPDTYNAKYRSAGEHKTAGIQDYFFYVLAEGDSGVNDHGDYYNVAGIGKDKAAQIMYRNLSYYLTSNSFFIDSRNGAIEAARDLFGVCSEEAAQTSQAWYAVGLGQAFGAQDMSIQSLNMEGTKCFLDTAETILGDMLFNDCSNTPAIGDSIDLGYQIDNNPPVIERMPFFFGTAGTSFQYQFSTKADFSAPKTYNIMLWVDYAHDQYPANDTIYRTLEHLPFADFSAENLIEPVPSCDITGLHQIEIDFILDYCSFNINQKYIELGYQLDGNTPVIDSLLLNQLVSPFTNYTFTFNQLEDFSSKGEYNLTYWIHYPEDENHSNDTVYNMRINNTETIKSHFFNFEDPSSTADSMYFLSDADNQVQIVNNAGLSNSKALHFSGGNGLNDWIPSLHLEWLKFDPWYFNDSYSSFACACVNARYWDSVKVEFDLRQTYSTAWDGINNESSRFTSSFRLTANGDPVSETFHPNTVNSDPFVHHYLNLKSYANKNFLLCLESRNLVSDKTDINGDGDNTFIDNLWIYNDGNVSLEEHQAVNKTWHTYPNPSNGEFTLSIVSDKPLSDSYQIFNASGKLVKQQSISMQAGWNDLQINIRDSPSGLYYIIFQGQAEKILKSE